MANFQIWPPRSDSNFDEHGPVPEAGTALPGRAGFFSQQLRLNLQETTLISLDAQPTGVKLVLKPREQNVVKVERDHEESITSSIFKFAGLGKGQTRVEAMLPETSVPPGTVRFAGPYATLFVTVRDPLEIAPNSDFIGGFIEGLAKYKEPSIAKLRAKFLSSPDILLPAFALAPAVQLGILEGLKQGMESFLELLKGAKNFLFDADFRDKIIERAAEMLPAWIDLIAALRADPSKFITTVLANGNAIGKELGDILGKDIDDGIANRSAADICRWAGKFVGLVLFEVILGIVIEIIGLGVAQAAKWIGEGARIVSELLRRINLKRLFGALEELKGLLRARFGRFARTIEEGLEAVEQLLRKITNGSELDAELERSFRATFTEPGSPPRPGAPTPQTPELAAGFKPGELPAFKKLLGKQMTNPEVAELARLWRAAANQGEDASLTLDNSRRLFNNHRGRFWRKVRESDAAMEFFRKAGCEFGSSPTTAPFHKMPDGSKFLMTIDHIVERQAAPGRALDPSNLRIVSGRENTVLLRQLTAQDPFLR